MHKGDLLALFGVLSTLSLTIWIAARVYMRKLELTHSAPRTALGASTEARLERIEQAVDAIAVEMERVSEGQRFTTKLLAERSAPVRGGPGGGPPRTDTPH